MNIALIEGCARIVLIIRQWSIYSRIFNVKYFAANLFLNGRYFVVAMNCKGTRISVPYGCCNLWRACVLWPPMGALRLLWLVAFGHQKGPFSLSQGGEVRLICAWGNGVTKHHTQCKVSWLGKPSNFAFGPIVIWILLRWFPRYPQNVNLLVLSL